MVRWARADGHEVQHRYFRRRFNADALAEKLAGFGRYSEVFETDTSWKPLDR